MAGCRQGLRSPESRRDSVWSTISIIKSKLGGKSNNSFENIREERFWEILGNNNNEEKTETTSTPHIDVSHRYLRDPFLYRPNTYIMDAVEV